MLLSYSTCPLECLKYGRRRPLDFDLNFVWRKNSLFLILPVTFNACLDQGERKRDKEAEDESCESKVKQSNVKQNSFAASFATFHDFRDSSDFLSIIQRLVLGSKVRLF